MESVTRRMIVLFLLVFICTNLLTSCILGGRRQTSVGFRRMQFRSMVIGVSSPTTSPLPASPRSSSTAWARQLLDAAFSLPTVLSSISVGAVLNWLKQVDHALRRAQSIFNAWKDLYEMCSNVLTVSPALPKKAMHSYLHSRVRYCDGQGLHSTLRRSRPTV
ncbi:hypothetical protein AAC387_Pa01g2607 [Persea americana]